MNKNNSHNIMNKTERKLITSCEIICIKNNKNAILHIKLTQCVSPVSLLLQTNVNQIYKEWQIPVLFKTC